MTLWWAHLTTSYFHFDAFGSTELDARVVMSAAFKRHCEQRDVDFGPDQIEMLDDMSIHPVKVGYAYRDEDSLFFDREKEVAALIEDLNIDPMRGQLPSHMRTRGRGLTRGEFGPHTR